jgi:hypothetical protein
MNDSILGDAGPEGRNQRGAAFEDQLCKMGPDLGWRLVCRSVDVYLKNGQERRGIDILWSLRNPRVDELHGWLHEAKCHEKPAPSALAAEIQTLHHKVAKLADNPKRKSHQHVGALVTNVAGGLLSHRSNGYKAEKARDALLAIEMRNKDRGYNPLRIAYLGPDTLEALADSFRTFGKPDKFYWPPTTREDGAWADACPPEQLAAGMLAYRAGSETVLWIRDTLSDHDVPALGDIAQAWGINPTRVVFAQLDKNRLRLVRDQWQQAAARSRTQTVGHLPDAVEARNLGYDRMNNFDELWPTDD